MADVVFSVSQINEYINKKLYTDAFLSRVTVVGEVTNFSMSSIGHAFFSLKDDDSMLGCIVYDYSNSELKDVISDGAKIKAGGRITFYKKSGTVQLAVEKASPQGVGDLYAKFEQTKKKLFYEGIFDAVHKQPLPEIPLHIGVVTSAAGAAVHDIINVAGRRFDGIHITVFPAQVQGQGAATQICQGIEYFNIENKVDVIIVGRGGGSFEDLFAFNEESVARAVFGSSVPIVSAVGHETDYSLCDMAADLRAPTPSAAAELVVKDKSAIVEYLQEYKTGLMRSLEVLVDRNQNRIGLLSSSIKAFSFGLKLTQIEERISAQRMMMKTSLDGMVERNALMVIKYQTSLRDLNPRGVLKRGYAIVYDENDNVVTSAKSDASNMQIEFNDGRISVERKG